MHQVIASRLAGLERSGGAELLHGVRVGLEKESLRAGADGAIAQTPHPAALGSALTHPYITTDYSEALLELITPPCASGVEALEWLSDLQAFVYPRLDGEMLWATSMPCVLAGEDNIPIAEYGSSNPARMKHIYRVGLGYRYGRVMQVIAGVHFNFSVDDTFWRPYRSLLGSTEPLREFRDAHYMGQVRNLLRWGWLVPYLFGASPAVCKSFFADGDGAMPEFDGNTAFEPFATSLRLGDIGYQNRKEEGLGVDISYDHLDRYIDGLTRAITTPAPQWQAIGVKVGDDYRQLNANILQIENEYYGSVRPKPSPGWLEMPVHALERGGISYVELRSLDVNAYHPEGVGRDQVRFLEVLALTALLADSPPLRHDGVRRVRHNLERVAHNGREAGCRLLTDTGERPLAEWGGEILDAMAGVAALFDARDGGDSYQTALRQQQAKLRDADRTPSARMLAEMTERGEGFYHFARRLSESHRRHFHARNLAPDCVADLEASVSESFERQRRIEAADSGDFDRFLDDYFAGRLAHSDKAR